MSLRGSSFASVSSNNITISLPTGSLAGDLAVLFVSAAAGVTNPTGWTNQYQNNAGLWTVLATTKTLSSGDISAGNVTVNCPAGSFDMHAGMVTFVGAGGGLRENEGTGGSGSTVTLTNTTTGSVLSTDTAIYWASLRWAGATIPTITPASGSATTLQSGSTANAYSVLADQSMPGGSLAVASFFASSNGCVAVQVIVEIGLAPPGGLLVNRGMDGGMVPQMKGGMNG
jgi:hypothetical protein